MAQADACAPALAYVCACCAHYDRHRLLQVDTLTQQLAEAQAAASDKGRLESSLAAADRARREAEGKLAAALRHNAATARDLATLQVRDEVAVQHT